MNVLLSHVEPLVKSSKRFSLKNVIFSSRLGEKVKCQWPAPGTARAQSCLKIGLLAEVFQFTPM